MVALKGFALHVFGLLSALYVYKSYSFFATCSNNGTTQADGNCTQKVIDALTPLFIQLELVNATYWIILAVFTVYLVYMLRKIHHLFFGMIDIVYPYQQRDVGYIIPPGQNKKDVINMVRKRRVVGDIPPPYPNGWYEIMRSADLPVGGAKSVYMNGHHFAVFRNANGHVAVTDAYCPHLGANLGAGGTVVGNCIQCPFHEWQFDMETGQCTNVPYAKKTPDFVKIKVWPSVEVNELILVWYDAEGRDPFFTVPECQEIKSGKWTCKGRSVHYINCHLEDILENGADLAHLQAVHEIGAHAGMAMNYRDSTWLGRLMTHHWKASWEALPHPNEHIGHMKLSAIHKLFGRWHFKPFDIHVSVDQVGPGVVFLYINGIFGRVLLLQTGVPEGPVLQRFTHYIYCSRWMPSFIASYLILYWDSVQVSSHIIIIIKPTLILSFL
jgi:cholesterol 7-dehydrogenase